MTMTRQNFTETPGLVTAVNQIEAELAAVDALGPLTRRVVWSAPFKISAWHVLEEVTALGRDPQDPVIDRWVADNLRRSAEAVVLPQWVRS